MGVDAFLALNDQKTGDPMIGESEIEALTNDDHNYNDLKIGIFIHWLYIFYVA